MPGWREAEQKVSFEQMPRHLVEIGLDSPDSLKEERTKWLESNGLTFVDLVSWKRAQGPEAAKRPPSRRRLLTQEQVAALDAEIEREGFQW